MTQSNDLESQIGWCLPGKSIRGADRRVRLGRQLIGTAAALGLASLTYARFEAEWFRLRHEIVPILPSGQDPWTILHLSDLHLTDTVLSRRKVEWVRNLVRLKPDLVIVTGDNLARAEALPLVLAALEPFFDHRGGFVFGSNDYYAARIGNPAMYLFDQLVPGASQRRQDYLAARESFRQPDLPWRELRDAQIEAGWCDLNNARQTVRIAGQVVELVGLDDPHMSRDQLPSRCGETAGEVSADIGITRGQVTGETAGGVTVSIGPEERLTIGVVHAPYQRALAALAGDGAELILAGHTHGGQLAIPGWGALVSNCDLPPRQASGLHQWGPNSTWLNVSAGLGTSPYTPVRFACRPEAVLLRLTPKA